jgi:hypothetical protein
MILMRLALFVVLLAATHAVAATPEKASQPAPAPPPAATPTSVAAPDTGTTAAKSDGASNNPDFPPPHIRIADPVPLAAPAEWPLRERITWGANLLLALFAYAGIMLALSALRKIERQTRSGEVAAEAAVQSAQAALRTAQALAQSERPWLSIAIKPSLTVENSFTVMATNCGRTPARIVATAEQTAIVAEELPLADLPEYQQGEPRDQSQPVFLLPGESTSIKSFCRDDVKGLCGSEERLKRIERWEEKIYIYGKIVYEDTVSPAGAQGHETAWCCWYIHGRQRSGLVFAGPTAYNSHS